jgi:acetyl-CoA carboxylase biotin carboxylase subunit
MFKKVLVANRGEIAVRILKACRELGIKTVAVYSEADRAALHVALADEARLLGAPPPLESYLNIDKIIQAARDSGAEAIHPGYGFLAENHRFAARCEKEGIVFVGSTSESIRLMGNKVESRKTMQKAGVPLIPGTEGKAAAVDDIIAEAKSIGLPVLIKATAGGGGKGMRSVHEEKSLKEAIESAMREANSAFGDPSVYIEKLIDEPRHIEFQILADQSGHTIHLFERECSTQRRHQKIVEETPSTALTPELRATMGEMAVRAARAAHYVNAGTVECLLDRDGRFYFLEMNTRIQVEHPVTELVVGLDLVKWQLRIATGETLTLKQENLSQKGHAIECRIYAEDPANGFLPSPGKILYMQEPAGPGIRNDCGIYSGCEVSPYYDPILSKLVVWAETRDDAIERMIHALEDYTIVGIKTTIPFLRDLVSHPEFRAGNTFTSFIPKNMPGWSEKISDELVQDAVCAGAVHEILKSQSPRARGGALFKQELSPWQTVGKWEIGTGKR